MRELDRERARAIVRLREKKLWSRRRLAKEAGMSPSAIPYIEEEKGPVTLASIGRIAKALGEDPEVILFPAEHHEELYGQKKGEAPTSQQPGEDEERRASGVSEDARSYLRMLCASWARLMGDINITRGPILEDLPQSPSAEDLRRMGPWVREVVRTCDDVLRTLIEEDVMRTVDPIGDAIQNGEYVPEDVRRAVVDFENALTVMFFQLRPAAAAWVTRLDERLELDRDLEERVTEWAGKRDRIPPHIRLGFDPFGFGPERS